MKKIFIFFSFLSIIGCTSGTDNTEQESDFASLIKNNSAKILQSSQLKNQSNTSSIQRLSNESENLISQEQLDNYLDILDIPEEYKSSLNLNQVNNIVDKLIDYHLSDNIEEVILNTTMSDETKEAVIKLLEDRTVQDVQDIVDFDFLSQHEKETLLVVNSLTNDTFQNNVSQASIIPFFTTSFLSQNCTGSGPIDCGAAFAIVGASIGGSCCGLGGAVIGGVIGFVIGEIIDKQ